ncbi:hypothetical protein FGIG_00436 [Fasciola gigantica]|uniref:Uncharacterized protein n=1 Tax=Fasciola gigantica TaxID=46835 RepID=A0A504Y855_FASGI|nr:hypothetical protein FGIG_00436 [Fasciola gigantica]
MGGKNMLMNRSLLNASSLSILGIERAPPKDNKGITYLAFIVHLHRASAVEQLLSGEGHNKRIWLNSSLATIKSPVRCTETKGFNWPTKNKVSEVMRSIVAKDDATERDRNTKDNKSPEQSIKLETCNLTLWPLYPAAMELERPEVSPSVDMDVESMSSVGNKVSTHRVNNPITALLCVAMSERVLSPQATFERAHLRNWLVRAWPHWKREMMTDLFGIVRLLGHTPQMLVNQSLDAIVHPSDACRLGKWLYKNGKYIDHITARCSDDLCLQSN